MILSGPENRFWRRLSNLLMLLLKQAVVSLRSGQMDENNKLMMVELAKKAASLLCSRKCLKNPP